MKILKFKTNIETDEMVAKVAPILDQEALISKWKVDTGSQDNILNVSGEEITANVVTQAVEKAGFKAEFIQVLGLGGNDL